MNPLVDVTQLKKSYSLGSKVIDAVKNITFSIQKGEVLGLVGESGCGKSTLGKMLLKLIAPTSGKIVFDGKEIHQENKFLLTRRMQMIFQDPFSSLNPRMTVRNILEEPFAIHKLPLKGALHLLDIVGLPKDAARRYPHEFSGGQRQRIGIARALALKPDFIVCDEPISALDVSIQAQIVNLLKELQKEFALTYLFIAHDLAMVRYISSSIAVMYAGEFVEMGEADEIYESPLHPYTQLLLSSMPKLKPQIKVFPKAPLPSSLDKGNGCPFASRCPYATAICREVKPELKQISEKRAVSCHLY